MFKEIEVHNIHGARVVLYPMDSVGIVVTKAVFKAGSWYEKGPKWGAAHLLEHIVHHGTKDFKTRKDISDFIEENGIYQNAATSGNSLWFDINFPGVSVNEGLQLLDQLAFYPTIPEAPLANEKNIIRQEYRDKWSNPNSRFWREQQKFLYGDNHLYARDALGDPDFVDQVTKNELQKIHLTFFSTNNLVISLAGNFEEVKVLSVLEKLLDSKPNHTVSRYPDLKFTPQGSYLFHPEDVERVALNLIYFIPGKLQMSVHDRVLLSLGSYILGGSLRSLLNTRLRHELGLVYHAGSSYSLNEYCGEFWLNASTSPESAKEALGQLKEVFATFLEKGVSGVIFDRSKKYMKLRTLLSYDSPQRIADIIAWSVFWDNRVHSPQETMQILDDATITDVLTVLKKYIHGEPILTTMAKKDCFAAHVKK